MQQTPAHDLANPDLLSAMPMASKVVEVGCSRGALAKEYKKRFPLAHYTGIEIDPDFGAVAKDFCNKIIIGNFEDICINEGIDGLSGSECWVFGDTLEHFQDPWMVLKKVRKLMSDNGCVCACIPNMQHWSIQFKLIRGDITYEESGLLDRTHLRWFTRKTIQKLFEESGFVINKMTPRIFQNQHNQTAAELIGSIASRLGADATEASQDSLPLQYVIKAIPNPLKNTSISG